MNKSELNNMIFSICHNAVIWHDDNGQIIIDSGINLNDLEDIITPRLKSSRVVKSNRVAVHSHAPKLYGGKVRKL